MQQEMLAALQRAERLLSECGWEVRPEWLRVRRQKLQCLSDSSDEFKNIARAIDKVLVGMGSFSDVPMYPKSDSSMTRAQARAEHRAVTIELGRLLAACVRKS